MKTYLLSFVVSTLGIFASLSFTTESAQAADSIFAQVQSSTSLNAADLPPADKSKQNTDVYIVQFAEQPVLNFTGSGTMAATKPLPNQKLDIQASAVQTYTAHLSQTHDQALQNCGVDKANTLYQYSNAFNGMAVTMTAAEAALMKSEPNVLSVILDQAQKRQTDSTRGFLKLNKGRFSSWRQGFTGEDVIIGIIDSGIDPENSSFADLPTPRRGDRGYRVPYGPPPASWKGDECDFGNTAFNPLDIPFNCTNKLLGARSYISGYLRGGDPSAVLAAGSTLSARDDNGHGSAAASIAAGNFGVQAIIDGEEIGTDLMSGVAPRARIAAYKVCWDGPAVDDPTTPADEDDDDACFTSDSMAAIDQAVADGVDVINFSIGGASASFDDLSSVAFLFAANAGVHVATSAGNAGPDAGSISSPAITPWVTAVGAINDNQSETLGLQIDAPTGLGSVIAIEGSGPVTLQDSGPISGELVLADPANGCDSLINSNAIANKIALVIRGGCNFNDKYVNAEAAGATAIVVYSDGTTAERQKPTLMGGLDDGLSIPGLMIGFSEGDTLANASTPAVTLDAESQISLTNRVAEFSARGPNLGANDIIKPDLVAPGVNILSAETTTENADEVLGPNGGGSNINSQQFINGTSFSSPHVAGVLALIKQAHPDWSPAIARSAMMTTARQNLATQFDRDPASPFEIGAGHVVPTAAFEPGLAYDVGLADYYAFSCGNNVQIADASVCAFLAAQGRSFNGSDLNLPSLGVGNLVGTQTVTRTVTNVDDEDPYRYRQRATTYRAVIDAPTGIDVNVSPRRLRLRPGESADYTITFTTKEDAEFDDFIFGALTWIEKGKKRRFPGYYRYLGFYDYFNYFYGYSYRYGFGRKHFNYYAHWFGYGPNYGYGKHRRNQNTKEVRSPIAVRPMRFSTLSEVDSQATVVEGLGFGSINVPITFGYQGTYTAAFAGLASSFLLENNVSATNNLRINCFNLPATTHIRMATFNEDTSTPGADNINLRVFRAPNCNSGPFVNVGFSAGLSSDETIDLANAPAGGYVFVVDYVSSGSADQSVDYKVWLSAVLGDQANTIVTAPTVAVIGASDNIRLDYQGLDAGGRYLGIVSHQNADGQIDRTIMDVNTQ